MPLIDLKVQHGQTQEVARDRLGHAIDRFRSQFGPAVHSVAWASDRNSVAVAGPGFRVDFRVDPSVIHVQGDLPLFAGLIGGAQGVRKMIESAVRGPIKP